MSSTENAPTRPPQATMAAWLVILCSVYVMLTSIESLGTLTSLTARTGAQDLLDQTPSLNLSVDQFLDIKRGTTVAAAVLAAVASVLGFFAWRRDLAARRMLAWIAVPIFLIGVFNSSMSTMLIAVATILLYREPVTSWFAGRTPPEVAPRGVFALGNPAASNRAGASNVGEGGRAADWNPLPVAAAAGEAPRPRQVTTAAIVTWIFGTLSVLMGIASLVLILADPKMLYEQMLETMPEAADQGVTQGLLQSAGIVVTAVMLALAVGTIVCAMGLLQRRKWGALGLMIQCWFITVFCAMGLLAGQLALLLPGLAAVWVIALVRSRDTRVWVLTAPQADGSGPGQFPDQAPYPGPYGQPPQGQFPNYPIPPHQHPGQPYPPSPQQPSPQQPSPQQPGQQQAGHQQPSQPGTPVPPPPAPDGGRRRADVPIDSPSEQTGQFSKAHVADDLNPHSDDDRDR